MSRSWFDNYENRRVGRYGRQSKEPSETFISDKYDFQNGNWSQLNNIMIPSLGMTIAQSISALKKSWKMYKGNLAKSEPIDKYAKRLLKLQSALGLEQSEFLKEELLQMGYTPAEIEGRENEGQDETDSEWSDEDRQLLAEEQREKENDFWGSEGEESEGQDQKEWTDLDQRMFQERLNAEREVLW